MSLHHGRFRENPLEEARIAETEINTPFGCVIIRDGEVITCGHNQVITTHDPTAHGETSAVSKAGLALGTPDLSGFTL